MVGYVYLDTSVICRSLINKYPPISAAVLNRVRNLVVIPEVFNEFWRGIEESYQHLLRLPGKIWQNQIDRYDEELRILGILRDGKSLAEKICIPPINARIKGDIQRRFNGNPNSNDIELISRALAHAAYAPVTLIANDGSMIRAFLGEARALGPKIKPVKAVTYSNGRYVALNAYGHGKAA